MSAMTESGKTSLVVCGAHLSGMPLNKQLTARGATLEQVTRTAALYRLFALPGEPRRPGLVRVEQDGRAILVEVWSMPTNQLGSFLALIPAPLGLGKVRLADGSEATGFICEGIGIVGAEDVSAFGGWRAYMAHCQKNPTAGNRPAVVERKINIKALPRDAELTLSDCALLIIDMQRDFIEPGGFGEALGNDVSLLQSAVGPCRALLSAARRAGIPVLHTREGHAADLVDLHEEKWLRGPRGKRIGDAGPMGRILIRGEAGHDFIDDLQPVAGETVIDKPGKGAFYQTPLHPLLQQLQVQTLIVCGVTTEVCVHTTVREANDRGYRVIVPADCCASYFPEFHRVGLEMIAAQGGIFGYVCQSSALLSALAGSALGKEGGH